MFTLGDVADILDSALKTGISIVDALAKLSEAAEAGKLDRKQIFDDLNLVDSTGQLSDEDLCNLANGTGHGKSVPKTSSNLEQSPLVSMRSEFHKSQTDLRNKNCERYARASMLPCGHVYEYRQQAESKVQSACILDSQSSNNELTIFEKRASCPPRLWDEPQAGIQVATRVECEQPFCEHENFELPISFVAEGDHSAGNSLFASSSSSLGKSSLGVSCVQCYSLLLRRQSHQAVQKQTLPIVDALGGLVQVAEEIFQDCNSDYFHSGGSKDESIVHGSEYDPESYRDILESSLSSRVTEILHSFQNLDNTMDKLDMATISTSTVGSAEVSLSSSSTTTVTDGVTLRNSSRRAPRPKTFVIHDPPITTEASSLLPAVEKIDMFCDTKNLLVCSQISPNQASSMLPIVHDLNSDVSQFSSAESGVSAPSCWRKEASVSKSLCSFHAADVNSVNLHGFSGLKDVCACRKKDVVIAKQGGNVRRGTYVLNQDYVGEMSGSVYPQLMQDDQNGIIVPIELLDDDRCCKDFQELQIVDSQSELEDSSNAPAVYLTRSLQEDLTSSLHMSSRGTGSVNLLEGNSSLAKHRYIRSGQCNLDVKSSPTYVKGLRPGNFIAGSVDVLHSGHMQESYAPMVSSIPYMDPPMDTDILVSDAVMRNASDVKFDTNILVSSIEATSLSDALKVDKSSVLSSAVSFPLDNLSSGTQNLREFCPSHIALQKKTVDSGSVRSPSRPLTYQLGVSRIKQDMHDDPDDGGNLSDSDTPSALVSLSRLSSGSMCMEHESNSYSSPFKLNQRKRLGYAARLADQAVSAPTIIALSQLHKAMSVSLSKLCKLHPFDRSIASADRSGKRASLASSSESLTSTIADLTPGGSCDNISIIEHMNSNCDVYQSCLPGTKGLMRKDVKTDNLPQGTISTNHEFFRSSCYQLQKSLQCGIAYDEYKGSNDSSAADRDSEVLMESAVHLRGLENIIRNLEVKLGNELEASTTDSCKNIVDQELVVISQDQHAKLRKSEHLVLERSGTYVLDCKGNSSQPVEIACDEVTFPSSTRIGGIDLYSDDLRDTSVPLIICKTSLVGAVSKEVPLFSKPSTRMQQTSSESSVGPLRSRLSSMKSVHSTRNSSSRIGQARSLSPEYAASVLNSSTKTAHKHASNRSTYILQNIPCRTSASGSLRLSYTEQVDQSKAKHPKSAGRSNVSTFRPTRNSKSGLRSLSLDSGSCTDVDMAAVKTCQPVKPILGKRSKSSLSPSTRVSSSHYIAKSGSLEQSGSSSMINVGQQSIPSKPQPFSGTKKASEQVKASPVLPMEFRRPVLNRRCKTQSFIDTPKKTRLLVESSVSCVQKPGSKACRPLRSSCQSRSLDAPFAPSELVHSKCSEPKSSPPQPLPREIRKAFLRKSLPSSIPPRGPSSAVRTRVAKGNENELLSTRLAALRLQLEEKRRQFEEEKKRKQQLWSEERASAMQEAFLAVVGGMGERTNSTTDSDTASPSWEISRSNANLEKFSREVEVQPRFPESAGSSLGTRFAADMSPDVVPQSPHHCIENHIELKPSLTPSADGSWFIDISGNKPGGSVANEVSSDVGYTKSNDECTSACSELPTKVFRSHVSRAQHTYATTAVTFATTTVSQATMKRIDSTRSGSTAGENGDSLLLLSSPAAVSISEAKSVSEKVLVGSIENDIIGRVYDHTAAIGNLDAERSHGKSAVSQRGKSNSLMSLHQLRQLSAFTAPVDVTNSDNSGISIATRSMRDSSDSSEPSCEDLSPANRHETWDTSASRGCQKVLVEEVVFSSESAHSKQSNVDHVDERAVPEDERLVTGAEALDKIFWRSTHATGLPAISKPSTSDSLLPFSNVKHSQVKVGEESSFGDSGTPVSSRLSQSKSIASVNVAPRKPVPVHAWMEEHVELIDGVSLADRPVTSKSSGLSHSFTRSSTESETPIADTAQSPGQELLSTRGSYAIPTEQERENLVEPALSKPPSWAFTFGDDQPVADAPGLTPEQVKKRDLFMRSRQKKMEAEKMKKMTDVEEKKRLQDQAAQEEQARRESELMAASERLHSDAYSKRLNDLTYQVSQKPVAAPLEQRASLRDKLTRQTSSGSSTQSESNDAPVNAFGEYNGPTAYQKPIGKSNRKIVQNAIMHCCLSGEVNKEAKVSCLEAIANSDASHFLILFREGLKFRSVYEYAPEKETVIKIFGIGPKVIAGKMIAKYYKYNSGGKEFDELQTKHLSIQVDGVAIKKELWEKKTAMVGKVDLNVQKKPPPSKPRVSR